MSSFGGDTIGKNASYDVLHEAAHKLEYHKPCRDDDKHYEDVGWCEEDEFKEITGERNGKSGYHDTDNGDKKPSTKTIERTRDPVDKNQVYGKSNKHRNGGELWMREALEV